MRNGGIIYLIGIGGIGMSAIARYYKHAGFMVSGYDRTKSDLTDALSGEGIQIHYEDRPDLVPTDEDTLVIYTPAIPNDLREMEFVRERGYRMVKRSAALGEIAAGKTCLAISGTHGKTTTSTLAAHIVTSSGEGCTAFLGGISKNYGTNLLLSNSKVIVAEADEFDRSFLKLFPHSAVVTSMDADHLDIYNDIEHMRASFIQFGSQVSNNLIIKKGLEHYFKNANTKARIYTYSFDNPEADFYASDLEYLSDGHISFTFNSPKFKEEECTVGVPGWINVENGVAAAALTLLHGTEISKIKEALRSFSGVRRRFDVRVNKTGCTLIDDYAHHPAELAASITSIRSTFPGRKICGIFQPHLYTRTRDFQKEFAKSLSMLDELLLLPIYPARELPIPGVDSSIIFDKVELRAKKMIKKENLLSELASRERDIIVTFGAGDIDRMVEPIENIMTRKHDA